MKNIEKLFGLKNGKETGWLRGGRGRNRTSKCRHPEKKKKKVM